MWKCYPVTELSWPVNLQPPMQNGEVVFEAPWQSRVFGMAVSLSEQGVFAWSDFQAALIEAVAEWEAQHADGAEYPYFEIFAQALQQVLIQLGVVELSALDKTAQALANLPHGYDHD